MIFRGSYEVTRQLKGQDLEATRKTTTVDLDVNGTLNVKAGATVNVGSNKIINVGAPVALTDASTKGYVDESVRHIYVGIDAPTPVLGKNEDLYFRGTTGGPRTLVGINGNSTNLSSDSTTIIVTTDTTSGQYYVSENGGISWLVRSAIADITNVYRSVVSPGPGNFVMSRKKVGTGVAAPSYTIDSGKTWQNSTVPEFTAANVTSMNVDKDNANPLVIMLVDSGKPLYSKDGGKTWAISNAPANNYSLCAINGKTVVITTADRVTYTSYDSGANFAVKGTLPALSVTWQTMLAIDENTFICGGTGTASNRLAYSYNAGSSWIDKPVLPVAVNAIDMLVNRVSGNIALVGNTGLIYQSNIASNEIWYAAGTNNPAHISRDIDTYGAGFVGVSYSGSPVVSMSDDGKYWSTDNTPGFMELYTRLSNTWIVLDVVQQREADARYLRSSGGIINGTLGMNNHPISGVSDPVNAQDVVTLKYLQSKLDNVSGTFIPAKVGTIIATVDTVASTVETFKYIISAKNGTTRYYSELNVIANGIDDPQSAEYSVMSIGGLDITTSVAKAANGDTELRLLSSFANTDVYLKRVIIDF